MYFVSYSCGGEELLLCKSYPSKAIIFNDIENAKIAISQEINRDEFRLKHNYKILKIVCEQK